MDHADSGTSEHTKPGTKPKGPRGAITVRVPPEQKAVYEAEAAAAGLPTGDYVALVLAKFHELDLPAYIEKALRANEEKKNYMEVGDFIDESAA